MGPVVHRGGSDAAAPAPPAGEAEPTAPELSDLRRHGPVELLHWPRDEALRRHLAADGTPRLLLVPPGAPTPVVRAADEDWIRLPADERDVATRLRALAR